MAEPKAHILCGTSHHMTPGTVYELQKFVSEILLNSKRRFLQIRIKN